MIRNNDVYRLHIHIMELLRTMTEIAFMNESTTEKKNDERRRRKKTRNTQITIRRA